MTKSVTPLDFIKTLPLRRENLTNPLTLLFGVAMAGLAIGSVLLYRRWNIQPTSFDLAKKAYANQKYQETLEHCNKALNLKVGPSFAVEILRAQAYIGLKKYEEAKEACNAAIDAHSVLKENLVLFADIYLQLGKALDGLGDWSKALCFYDQSLTELSNRFNQHSFHRLKFEALIGKAQVFRKRYQHSETSKGKAEAIKMPYQHAAMDALFLAYAKLEILSVSGNTQEEYREFLVQFYHTRIYYFLDLGAHMLALYDCVSALKLLDKLGLGPSNDQETELFVLYSLHWAKQGEKSKAFSEATEALQIDDHTSVDDTKAHLSTKITNKKILAAAYFICALCSTQSSAAFKYYEEALKNAENDDLKVAILFERGNLYLKLGKACMNEDAKYSFMKALKDFEDAEELAKQKVIPESDLSKSLLHILEFNDLQEKIKAIYEDENIARVKADLQSQSPQSESSTQERIKS